jgi:hypothetical protein
MGAHHRSSVLNGDVTTYAYDIYDNMLSVQAARGITGDFFKPSDWEACLILGKRIKEYQFLDVARISSSFPQAKSLSFCLLKKAVSLVSLVSTVSFRPDYNRK